MTLVPWYLPPCLSDEDLVGGHEVGERRDDGGGEEVKDETEEDGDREGGQGLPKGGQTHEGEAEADEDGHEAGHRCVPVAVRRRLADQD